MYERSRSLFECHIAGVTYSDWLDVIDELKIGTTVTLVSEPDNPYDPNAIAIYYKRARLGYVPRYKNGLISDLLYFGHLDIFEARILNHDQALDQANKWRILIRIKDNRK